jgi:hypothetical protein
MFRGEQYLPAFLVVDSFRKPLICNWLDARSLSVLDVAMRNHSARWRWLNELE